MVEEVVLVIVVAVVIGQLVLIVRTTPGPRMRRRGGVDAPQVGWVALGPTVAALDLAVVSALPWADLRLAASVATGLPAAGALLVVQAALLARHAAPLLDHEHQSGRQSVLDVAHGALSTNLRLLERRTDLHRANRPQLVGLATNLNSRLREILALGDAGLITSEDPSSLVGPVQTLVRAYGADASMVIRVKTLTESEHELALFAVTELVRCALEAGAGRISVSLFRRGSGVAVQVMDDEQPPDSDRGAQERERRFDARGLELREFVRRGQVARLAIWPGGR